MDSLQPALGKGFGHFSEDYEPYQVEAIAMSFIGIRWLSLGQVLTRLVERCKVVAVFLDKIGATFGRMFCKTHPDSSAAAWKVLLLFTSSYFCEIRLSVMVAIET
ncbi:hypothetical protein T02_15318 [Trichinella nativa]|uniref:Uncharacterized protein n=1 Tax=Trichinella nativa TaxID=6335 RepID=A0A0V1LV46_9BILA|nr:hypothetical protein T02_15318 [Trichinella nativa]